MARIVIFGQIKLLKKNPWFSGKLAGAVAKGLAKPRKDVILATPPPWLGDPSKLSDAQLVQVMRFSAAAAETRGKDIEQRLANIKAKASGPTGAPKKAKVRVVRIGRVITEAERRGLTVSPVLRELAKVPAPAPTAPAPTGIRP